MALDWIEKREKRLARTVRIFTGHKLDAEEVEALKAMAREWTREEDGKEVRG